MVSADFQVPVLYTNWCTNDGDLEYERPLASGLKNRQFYLRKRGSMKYVAVAAKPDIRRIPLNTDNVRL
jgi:hypothetical protein